MPKPIVLAVDVGGTHVKALLAGEEERRRFKSGPEMTPQAMVDGVLDLAQGWAFDRVSVGIPTPVRGGKAIAEPFNLGKGWVGFDFEDAFGVPTKVVNDAVMQAIGSYDGGRMLYLGLGTGLGSTLIADGIVEPLEPSRTTSARGRSRSTGKPSGRPRSSRSSSGSRRRCSPTTSFSAEGPRTISTSFRRIAASARTCSHSRVGSASGSPSGTEKRSKDPRRPSPNQADARPG
jgi:ROK family